MEKTELIKQGKANCVIVKDLSRFMVIWKQEKATRVLSWIPLRQTW